MQEFLLFRHIHHLVNTSILALCRHVDRSGGYGQAKNRRRWDAQLVSQGDPDPKLEPAHLNASRTAHNNVASAVTKTHNKDMLPPIP